MADGEPVLAGLLHSAARGSQGALRRPQSSRVGCDAQGIEDEARVGLVVLHQEDVVLDFGHCWGCSQGSYRVWGRSVPSGTRAKKPSAPCRRRAFSQADRRTLGGLKGSPPGAAFVSRTAPGVSAMSSWA